MWFRGLTLTRDNTTSREEDSREEDSREEDTIVIKGLEPATVRY